MVDEAKAALTSVDALVLLVDVSPEPPAPGGRQRGGLRPRHEAQAPPPDRKGRRSKPPAIPKVDHALEAVLEEVRAAKKPTVLALNKVDQLRDKRQLLPMLEDLGKRGFAAMVPISAKTGHGVPALLEELGKLVPESDPLFDDETLTDRAERWFVAEFVREQVFLLTKREVPYSVAVSVDEFEERPGRDGRRDLRVAATISVDKEAHKRILVGAGGAMIREIGSRARHELGERFSATVHLSLFVRVDEGWTGDRAKLRDFGYESSGR
jgi:GTP-binding protein Era